MPCLPAIQLESYALSMEQKTFSRARGFTLIELIVTVIIVAILTLIATPSFLNSVRKSRRQEAINALKSLQLYQERYRANNPTYGTLANLTSTYGTGGVSSTTPSGNYTLAITSPTASSYIATATAVAGTSQVNDTIGSVSCTTLTVNQEQPIDSSLVQALSIQRSCWGL